MTVTTGESTPMWAENLEEWILDENKVISAKFVSRSLDVHINVAKEMMFHFVHTHPDSDLESIHMISGQDKDLRKQIRLVRSGDIENLGWKEITSNHIYAVAKKSTLEDDKGQNLTLTLLDTVSEYPHVTSNASISNDEAVVRDNAVKIIRSPMKKSDPVKKTPVLEASDQAKQALEEDSQSKKTTTAPKDDDSQDKGPRVKPVIEEPPPKKKKMEMNGKKQASIMNFFKKK